MVSRINLHSFFLRFPEINLGDIKLRDLRLSDKEAYLEMSTHPDVERYSSDEGVPRTIEETTEEIKFWGGLFYRKQGIFWTIADAKTDEFMGTVGISDWNFYNQRAEISYYLLPKFWGKKIMTKVLNNILIFAFKRMDIYRLEARTMLGNEVSRHLLQKVGFKLEGIQRGYRLIRGQREDITLYAAVRSDFHAFLSE